MVVVVAGAVVVAGVVQVGGVAGDQDPGDRAVAGQPPARLGVQREAVAALAAQAGVVAEEAVQVHGDRQLGPNPTRLGQPAAFQVAAGQLDTGHQPGADHRCGYRGRRPGGPAAPGQPARSGRPRPPAAPGARPSPPRWRPTTTPGDHGAARPGPRHPQGRRPPGDGPGPAAPRRVQPPRRLHQHRFRLGGQVVGELWVPWANTCGMGHESSPSVRAWPLRSGDHRTRPGPSGPQWRPPPPPSAAEAAAT